MRREPQNSPAIILRQVNYGESDLIISFLCADGLLLRGFARGGRKSVKRFGAALEPFSQVEISWQPGRGELLTLLEAELLQPRHSLRDSLERLALAAYASELLEMLMQQGEPQPELFALLGGYLDCLAHQGDTALARLLFELRLVQQLGYIPHLLHCSECFVQFESGDIPFDPQRGGSLCMACDTGQSPLRVGLGTLGSLSRSLHTAIDLFEGFRFGERTLKEGAAMLAAVMQSVLPRAPKSLRFLQQSADFGDP